MKRLLKPVIALCAVALLLPIAAAASSYVANHKVITQDCSKDPTANIGSEDSEYTFKGACKAINLEGSHNKVHIASAKALIINGDDNDVDVATTDIIFVTGSHDHVSWKKGLTQEQPKVSNSNSTSTVEQAK